MHPRHQNGCDRALAHPSQSKAGESDAELYRRQEFIEPLLEPLDDPGANAALLDQLLDSRVPDADHGKLSGHEERIRGHQQHYHDDPEEDQSDHNVPILH